MGIAGGGVVNHGYYYLNPPAWSISAEFAAYLLFPLLSLITLRGNARNVSLVLIIALLTIYLLPFLQSAEQIKFEYGLMDIVEMPSFFPLIRCISEFAVGLIAYRISGSEVVRKYFESKPVCYTLTVTMLLLLFLPNSDVTVVLLMPVFILMLAVSDNLVTLLIGSKIVFFLGEISYSIYLLHWSLFHMRMHEKIADKLMAFHLGYYKAHFVGWVGLYTTVICCSWLTFTLIEKPCRKWIKRLEERYFEGPAL